MDPQDDIYQYDICLSFAGEQRQLVEGIAEGLRNCGIRVFYDGYEKAALWGKDLYEHLDWVYQAAAKYCVIFASAEYADKVWTSHERRSAQARALREKAEYILPVRVDDTEIPGLRPTIAYIDLRTTTASELLNLIVTKVQSGGAQAPPAPTVPPLRDSGSSGAARSGARSRVSVRCVAVITGHRQRRGINGMRRGITAAAFSPDGHTLATGSGDNTVMLWDISDPAKPVQLAVLSEHTDGVMSVGFSPDSRMLVTGSADKTAMIWDASDRSHPTLINTITGHQGDQNTVKFSVDGDILTTGVKDAVFLWDVKEPGRCDRIATIDLRRYYINSVAFSPDRQTLATGGVAMEIFKERRDTAMLWNISDPRQPKQISVLNGHREVVHSVEYSHDGAILATASDDKTIALWDVSDPDRPVHIYSLTGHREVVWELAFSPRDRTLATASFDKTAILWDISDPLRPSRIATLTDHHSLVCSVAFSFDGRILATGGRDAKVRLWQLA